MPGYQNSDYIDVAERIAEAREKYPDGRLRPANPSEPYKIESIDGQTYIVVVAAFHRTADDNLPGIGMAYEVFPGKTNFTRGSELQNAETSAWGRAMVAALVADTKRGIASAQEVRNRRAENDEPQNGRAQRNGGQRARATNADTPHSPADEARGRLKDVCAELGLTLQRAVELFAEAYPGRELKTSDDAVGIDSFIKQLQDKAKAGVL